MSGQDVPPIPWPRLSAFVRQVTHDVRNGLNAIDLQAAFLAEITPPGELSDETRRLREMVRDVTRSLQKISQNFQGLQPNLIDCPASLFIESLRHRLPEQLPDAAALTWEGEPDETTVAVDVDRAADAIVELVRNAFQFREGEPAFTLRSEIADGRFVVTLIEPKSEPSVPPESWGAEPLVTTRRGAYGLGLFRIREALRVQKATLEQRYDAARGAVVSTVAIPLAHDGR